MCIRDRFENQALFCLSNFTGEEIEFHLPEEFLSDRTSVLLQNYPGLVIAPVITLRPYESLDVYKRQYLDIASDGASFLRILFLGVLPVGCLAVGAFVFLRRRHL